MRVSSSGKASGLQPEDASSILATRSRFVGVSNLGAPKKLLMAVDFKKRDTFSPTTDGDAACP